jgi:hypothetical protein
MKSSIGSTNANFVQLISDYLTKVSSETLEPELKMSLNIGDNPVFKSLVLSGDPGSGFKPIRTSHQNLKQAYLLAKFSLPQTYLRLNWRHQAKVASNVD